MAAPRGTPYVPSPLLVGDRLYFTQANNAILTSLYIKTGDPVVNRERLPEQKSFYGSPVAASKADLFGGPRRSHFGPEAGR